MVGGLEQQEQVKYKGKRQWGKQKRYDINSKKDFNTQIIHIIKLPAFSLLRYCINHWYF